MVLEANVPHQQSSLLARNYNANPKNEIFHFAEIADIAAQKRKTGHFKEKLLLPNYFLL